MKLARCGAIALVFGVTSCTEPADSPDVDSIQMAGSTGSQQEEPLRATAGQVDTLPIVTMLALPVARLQEELRIDGYEADLVPINHLLVGTEGQVVLSQAQDRELIVFDARGARMGTFGAPGSGPGEFQVISRMGWRGDSIWVWDIRQRRATVIAADLASYRSFQTGSSHARWVGNGPDFVYPFSILQGITADGLEVRLAGAGTQQKAPAGVPQVAIAVLGPDSAVTTLLDSLPSVDRNIETETGGQLYLTAFGNAPVHALSPDGGRLAVAWAPPIEQRPTHLTVSVTTIDGTRLFSRVYPFRPARVTRAVWDSVVEDVSSRVSQGFREPLRAAPVPAAYPPVQAVAFSNDLGVWIRMHEADGVHYLVLSPEGEPLGRVMLPETSKVVAADGDLIYVVEEDELGVDSVVRYRVRW